MNNWKDKALSVGATIVAIPLVPFVLLAYAGIAVKRKLMGQPPLINGESKFHG